MRVNMVGLCLKYDRKACVNCLAGQNGHFQSQIRVVVSQLPSLFFVQPRDPSMLCDLFMGAFRIHSSTRFVTGEDYFALSAVEKEKQKFLLLAHERFPALTTSCMY